MIKLGLLFLVLISAAHALNKRSYWGDVAGAEVIKNGVNAGIETPGDRAEPNGMFFQLFSLDPYDEPTMSQKEGVAIAMFLDDRAEMEEVGTICLDAIPTGRRHAVADMVCRHQGYANATRYSTFAEHPYNFKFISSFLEYYMTPILRNMSCPDDASDLEDCSYDRGVDHTYTYNDSMVVFCDNPNKTEWEISYGGLFREVDGEFLQSNEGLAVIGIKNIRTEQQIFGTICDDHFSNSSANIACQAMGYGYALSWDNHRNYQYVSQELLNYTSELHNIVMDQLECPPSAREIEDCTYDLLKQDCSHEEDVTLVCGGVSDEWEITGGGLFRKVDGNIVQSNEGVAVVELTHTGTGEIVMGTVCDDRFNNRSADIACEAMGFDYAVSWENHGSYQYISEDEMADVEVVMDQFECPADARELEECTYDLMEHDCSHSEDVTLVCGGGSTTEPPTWSPTEPTWGPTSYPLDDEIAVKFGGLEVQLKVNPKKGRAKIVDILEEIVG